MPKHFTEHLTRTTAVLSLSTPMGQSSWTPNTDVYETDQHLIIKMELAGIRKDDLEITLQDRLLVVRGYRQDTCPHRQTRCSFRQMEIDYGYFERRILIPSLVDATYAQAHFHNGFLHIELPKTTRPTPTAVTVVIERIS
jgi:HSP20 family protein